MDPLVAKNNVAGECIEMEKEKRQDLVSCVEELGKKK